ncbi:MAG TPA: hypothetical protein VKZ53_20305 [Candidatus Angelobacter sp.]|nr:hypothetical protein [Candidatus Angelobacter sp.]
MTKLLLSLVFCAGFSAAAWAGASCPLNPQNQTVTICTPANGATGLVNPVHVNAGTTDTHPITTMWIYVDTVKVFAINNVNFIDTTINMTTGTHRFVVQAQDSAGTVFKTVESVTVGGAPNVVVTPSAATLVEGATQQFSANVAVTWSATCGTITTGGLYTAPGASGPCTVTATSGANSGNAAVTVVTGVVVSPNSVTVPENGTQQFTANVAVTWSASCGTITAAGLYTAPNATGSCTITAMDDVGHSGMATVTVVPATAVSGYLSWKNDIGRTGQQRNETILTPANVHSSSFGKKFSVSVDGGVFAQPLYVANLTVNSATHNVVFVATEHDSVYAFDADKSGPALWRVSFLSSGVTTVPQGNVGSTIFPEIGISSTPVIDPDTETIYVVAETLENGGTYVHRLHALDIHNGAERPGSPVVISGDVFLSKPELQRSGLVLLNGLIYISFASQGDNGLWQGYVFAYDPSTLGRSAVFNVVPTGIRAGIWMAGAAPSADASGNLYVMTGNGTFTPGSGDFGDSIVKLSPSLSAVDFFTPFDQAADNTGDRDVGSGGPLVVPDQAGAHPHELIGCGKGANLYVIDRDNMGHFQAGSNSQIIQSLSNVVGSVPAAPNGQNANDHCWMTPAFWEQNVYFVGNRDTIKAFHLDPSTGLLSTSPTSQGNFFYPFPGAQPVVSSNGATSGIVWTIDHRSPATLHAYDATNVAVELYNSTQAGTRDSLGTGEKFTVPTIINGKVYVGTKSSLVVFGLL